MCDEDDGPRYLTNGGLHAYVGEDGDFKVVLDEHVKKDADVMHALHHRVIDLLVDASLLHRFDGDLDERLTALAPDIISDFIQHMVNDSRAAITKAKLATERELQRDIEAFQKNPPKRHCRGEDFQGKRSPPLICP